MSRDLPANCQDAMEEYGMTTSRGVLIWPDENIDKKPFVVYCDVETFPNKGVAVIVPQLDENTTVVEETEVPSFGVTPEDIGRLTVNSEYCYLPVKLECKCHTFHEGDLLFSWLGRNGRSHNNWGSADSDSDQCSCGQDRRCGGEDGQAAMGDRKCNCDVGDGNVHFDAGILRITRDLPLTSFFTQESEDGCYVKLALGNIYCAESPINLNECEMGFHDCHEKAVCVDREDKYGCNCIEGWQALGVTDENKWANGRECWDDNECNLNKCLTKTTTCENTPGSYICHCKPGFQKVAPYDDHAQYEDINECANASLSQWDPNAYCVNTFGSYKCECKRGFRGDGKYCEQICLCSAGETLTVLHLTNMSLIFRAHVNIFWPVVDVPMATRMMQRRCHSR